VAILLTACGGSTPDKVEQTLGETYQCAPDDSYAGYRPITSSCNCKSTWAYNGVTFCNRNCGNPENDPGGPWCFTEAACNGLNWEYCRR
jgi:hypothetical protein